MAINMYLKFEGPEIKGESSAPGYEGQIEILSWSHGFSQPTSVTRSTAGAGTVEQASHQNFNVSKYLDVATNTLLKYCWSGKQIQKATLTCCRPSGAGDKKPVEYLKVIMEHVIIANFTVSGGPGDLPVENLALHYGIIQYNYVDQKGADGNTTAKHNLETHTIE